MHSKFNFCFMKICNFIFKIFLNLQLIKPIDAEPAAIEGYCTESPSQSN